MQSHGGKVVLWERNEIRRINGAVRIDHAEIADHTNNVNRMLGSIRYGKLASDGSCLGQYLSAMAWLITAT